MDNPTRNIIITITALVLIVAGSIVMCGWIFSVPALETIIPGFVAMKFNTALCFVLFGITLLFTQGKPGRYYRTGFFVLSLLACLIGLITLCEDLFHINTGIDQLFINDKTPVSADFPYQGRMAFTSALSFTLLSIGFLASELKKRVFDILSQCLFQIVVVFSAKTKKNKKNNTTKKQTQKTVTSM